MNSDEVCVWNIGIRLRPAVISLRLEAAPFKAYFYSSDAESAKLLSAQSIPESERWQSWEPQKHFTDITDAGWINPSCWAVIRHREEAEADHLEFCGQCHLIKQKKTLWQLTISQGESSFSPQLVWGVAWHSLASAWQPGFQHVGFLEAWRNTERPKQGGLCVRVLARRLWSGEEQHEQSALTLWQQASCCMFIRHVGGAPLPDLSELLYTLFASILLSIKRPAMRWQMGFLNTKLQQF